MAIACSSYYTKKETFISLSFPVFFCNLGADEVLKKFVLKLLSGNYKKTETCARSHEINKEFGFLFQFLIHYIAGNFYMLLIENHFNSQETYHLYFLTTSICNVLSIM